MRKVKGIVCLSLSAALVLMTSACSSSSDAKSSEDSEFKGQSLSVFDWPEYIPDDVIHDFEDKYGVTVNASTFDTNEEMLAKIQSSAAGTYDIVCPSDFMVQYMISEVMLAELDKDKLTNFSNLNETYLNQSFDPENKYSIPLGTGIIIPAYNKAEIPEGTITSLDDLFSADLKGKVCALDDMRIMIGLTAMSMGYTLSETDPEVLSKINEKFMTLKDNIYSMTIAGPEGPLVSGDVPAGYIYNGSIALAMMDNPDIKPVWPTEGSYIWIDNMCITADSTKKDLAQTFINYILEAEVDAKMRNEMPCTDPNKAGWALVDESIRDNEALNIPDDQIKKGQYPVALDTDTLKIYSQMWTEFTK